MSSTTTSFLKENSDLIIDYLEKLLPIKKFEISAKPEYREKDKSMFIEGTKLDLTYEDINYPDFESLKNEIKADLDYFLIETENNIMDFFPKAPKATHYFSVPKNLYYGWKVLDQIYNKDASIFNFDKFWMLNDALRSSKHLWLNSVKIENVMQDNLGELLKQSKDSQELLSQIDTLIKDNKLTINLRDISGDNKQLVLEPVDTSNRLKGIKELPNSKLLDQECAKRIKQREEQKQKTK